MNTNNNLNEKPGWFNGALVSKSLDAREMLQAGQHPLAEAVKITSGMKPGQVFELITPFKPMPLIEKIREIGFSAYVESVSDSEIHTYFCKVV